MTALCALLQEFRRFLFRLLTLGETCRPAGAWPISIYHLEWQLQSLNGGNVMKLQTNGSFSTTMALRCERVSAQSEREDLLH